VGSCGNEIVVNRHSQPTLHSPHWKFIMNSFKKLLLTKSILAAAVAASGVATPAIGQTNRLQPNLQGTPNDGMVCRTGYTANFNGSSLKCSKTSEIKVDLACLVAPFTIKVVRVGAGGTPKGLDVCDKSGGVTVTSGNDISNFVRGSDYEFAKQDDAQIAVRAEGQRQAEATALGVAIGEVEVEVGTAVTDTTSGDSTDKSKVPLTFFTFAVKSGGLLNSPVPSAAFVPRGLPR
jgi:hypothetical protein